MSFTGRLRRTESSRQKKKKRNKNSSDNLNAPTKLAQEAPQPDLLLEDSSLTAEQLRLTPGQSWTHLSRADQGLTRCLGLQRAAVGPEVLPWEADGEQ